MQSRKIQTILLKEWKRVDKITQNFYSNRDSDTFWADFECFSKQNSLVFKNFWKRTWEIMTSSVTLLTLLPLLSESLAQVLFCEFCEISENKPFYRTPLVAASIISLFTRVAFWCRFVITMLFLYLQSWNNYNDFNLNFLHSIKLSLAETNIVESPLKLQQRTLSVMN